MRGERGERRVRRKMAARQITVERKRMQLRGPWKREIMNSSPVPTVCSRGITVLAVRFEERGKVRIIPACKENLEAMTYFNLPSPHS